VVASAGEDIPLFHLAALYPDLCLGALVARRANLGKPQSLEEELQGFDTSNTVIRFTPDKPLPTPIIEKIVKLRIEEIDAHQWD
jgi:hypothetical protein